MVALVIIYNHKFDKNIPILEEIYAGRFSHIFHLVPFYTGNKDNVLTVYENSYFFQGYIAQGYQLLKHKGDFEHYMFVGDDVLLNPEINENNYKEYFKLADSTSFLPDYLELSERKEDWSRLNDAVDYRPSIRGLEIQNEFPTYDVVLDKFKQKKLKEPFVKSERIYKLPQRKSYENSLMGYFRYLRRKKEVKKLLETESIKLEYPLVGSYSDIFIVSKKGFDEFAHLCGVFSATRLFVELAIPTAMVIACEEIVTEYDNTKKGLTFWSKEENEEFEKKYNNSLNQIFNNFPQDTLYVHPVKLSKWKKNKQ